ncbi:unnamed protein product [Brassica oleracea var. botrytis]
MTFALRQLVLLKPETSWLHTIKFFLVSWFLLFSLKHVSLDANATRKLLRVQRYIQVELRLKKKLRYYTLFNQ